ncbi:hypothetical protein EIN_152860 [Entamoeba invadens IP1]|uniref:Uncharacterized protein n=1 Tax=Entamoeba invadens IP1 TaxID=370355 RepID=A0A0A1U8Q9_ENTIV|nr:hypothetical protein EIN_152860 [Entamoeba invadens IP1]ELP91289.1 hypothetical protein EIN_152860 [Entamoeba invadens IP1]|eukprot:XP_004258060.1 hypothetical protein EIN_152860 [Entamoeba invadens IP1]
MEVVHKSNNLERFYLLNVILYLNKRETILKFILINKKCLQSCQDLYTNPNIKDSFEDLYFTIALFKKINTLNFDIKQVEYISDLISKHLTKAKEVFESIKMSNLKVTIDHWNNEMYEWCKGVVGNFKEITLLNTYIESPLSITLSNLIGQMMTLHKVVFSKFFIKKMFLEKVCQQVKIVVLKFESSFRTLYSNIEYLKVSKETTIIFSMKTIRPDDLKIIHQIKEDLYNQNKVVVFCEIALVPLTDILSQKVLLLQKNQLCEISYNQVDTPLFQKVVDLYALNQILCDGIQCPKTYIFHTQPKSQLKGILQLNLYAFTLLLHLEDFISNSLHTLNVQRVALLPKVDLETFRLIEINFTACDFEVIKVPKTLKIIKIQDNQLLSKIEGLDILELDIIYLTYCPSIQEVFFKKATTITFIECGIEHINEESILNSKEVVINNCKYKDELGFDLKEQPSNCVLN